MSVIPMILVAAMVCVIIAGHIGMGWFLPMLLGVLILMMIGLFKM